jgi:hypothetical protein
MRIEQARGRAADEGVAEIQAVGGGHGARPAITDRARIVVVVIRVEVERVGGEGRRAQPCEHARCVALRAGAADPVAERQRRLVNAVLVGAALGGGGGRERGRVVVGVGVVAVEADRLDLVDFRGLLEARVDGVEDDLRRIPRFPLDRAGEAEAFLLEVLLLDVEQGGDEGECAAGGDGRGDAGAGVGVGEGLAARIVDQRIGRWVRAAHGVAGGGVCDGLEGDDAIGAGARGAGRRGKTGAANDGLAVGEGRLSGEHRAAIGVVERAGLVAVAVVLAGALVVGAGEGDAQRVVEELVGIEGRDARVPALAAFVIGLLQGEGDLALIVDERAAGHEVDRGAERAFVGGGVGGLADGQRLEEVRSKGVEVEAAAAVGVRA